MPDRERIVERARACIGARFRAQGRDPATGLDCAGLAAIAFDRPDVPRDYGLRGGELVAIANRINALGLCPIEVWSARSGDLLLLLAGPAQWHLGVLTQGGFVHADAGLRRVVETPGLPRWPIAGAWRRD